MASAMAIDLFIASGSPPSYRMRQILLAHGLFVALAALAAACGGNVIVDLPTGGAGGSTSTYANSCEEFAAKAEAKYEECGLDVPPSSGTLECTPDMEQQ